MVNRSNAPSGAPLSDVELAAWRGMLQAHAQVTRALDAQLREAHGLSVSSYEVLLFLGRAPDQRMRMADIAARTLLTRSGVTRLVDRLVELGHVSRSSSEGDGRGLYAELTPAGAGLLRAAGQTHREGVRACFLGRLTTTDQVILGDIWQRLLADDASQH